MPDASTIDPAAILQRVETNIETQEAIGFTIAIHRSDAIQLCRLLRTALADTRRVDLLEQPHITLQRGRGGWIIYGFPNKRLYSTLREGIDAAMAATPREETHA